LITVSRARGWSEQGVRWPHRRRADILFRLFAGGVEAIDRSIDVDLADVADSLLANPDRADAAPVDIGVGPGWRREDGGH
jgi:hypothetical protein